MRPKITLFRFPRHTLFRRDPEIEPFWLALVRTTAGTLGVCILIAYTIYLIVLIATSPYTTRQGFFKNAKEAEMEAGMGNYPNLGLWVGFRNLRPIIMNTCDRQNPVINVSTVCPSAVPELQLCESRNINPTINASPYNCNVAYECRPCSTDTATMMIVYVIKPKNQTNDVSRFAFLPYDPKNQIYRDKDTDQEDWLDYYGVPLERRFQSEIIWGYPPVNISNIYAAAYTFTYSQTQYLFSSFKDVFGFKGNHFKVGRTDFDPLRIGDIQDGVVHYVDPNNKTVVPITMAPAGSYNTTFAYTEEFRQNTILSAAGAAGGVFSFVAVVFYTLFGRILAYPFLGVKQISPFGMVGQFSGSLNRNLRKHYPRAFGDDQAGVQAARGDLVDLLSDFVVSLSKPPKNETRTSVVSLDSVRSEGRKRSTSDVDVEEASLFDQWVANA